MEERLVEPLRGVRVPLKTRLFTAGVQGAKIEKDRADSSKLYQIDPDMKSLFSRATQQPGKPFFGIELHIRDFTRASRSKAPSHEMSCT